MGKVGVGKSWGWNSGLEALGMRLELGMGIIEVEAGVVEGWG